MGDLMNIRRLKVGLCLFVLAIFISPLARGAFPEGNRPIKLIVPYSSGGPADKTARQLAEALQSVLGSPVIVENIAGASGTLGATKVLQATPDGYTLLFSHVGVSTSYALYRKADTLDDFEYLGVTSELPMFLVGRLNLEPADASALLKWMAAKKGAVTIANAGTGSASHLCTLLLQSVLQVTFNAIPYKGTAPAMNDVVGGHVDLLCDQSSTAGPQILGGRVKGYAVTAINRFRSPQQLATIPTLDEAGLKGFDFSVFQGLYAPKGTPRVILETLNRALREALKNPEYVKRQSADGATVVTDTRLSREGHKALVKAETAKWASIIKTANVYAD